MAAVRCLRHVSLQLAEFNALKVEGDGLRQRVISHEIEKRIFEGCYDFLVGEKASMEEHVVSLDVEVESLEVEKEALERRVKLKG